MSSMNDDLIKAYKNTRKLIEKNPDDREQIINEYIDLVDKINNYYNPQNNHNNQNNHNKELSKMLKNPLEISIFNNFQKYNGNPNNNIINPLLNNPDFNNTSQKDSITQLANLSSYWGK